MSIPEEDHEDGPADSALDCIGAEATAESIIANKNAVQTASQSVEFILSIFAEISDAQTAIDQCEYMNLEKIKAFVPQLDDIQERILDAGTEDVAILLQTTRTYLELRFLVDILPEIDEITEAIWQPQGYVIISTVCLIAQTAGLLEKLSGIEFVAEQAMIMKERMTKTLRGARRAFERRVQRMYERF